MKNTSSKQTIFDLLSKTVCSCLTNPGSVIQNIHRSDGITHNSIIEQLYANFYSNEKYDYKTTTSSQEEFLVLENYYTNHKIEMKNHINKIHNGQVDKLRENACCELDENCIYYSLNTIRECIKEYDYSQGKKAKYCC